MFVQSNLMDFTWITLSCIQLYKINFRMCIFLVVFLVFFVFGVFFFVFQHKFLYSTVGILKIQTFCCGTDFRGHAPFPLINL